MSAGTRTTRSGLTLLEVVISISLIAMLMGALLTFFWQTLEVRERTVSSADRTKLVNQILDRMADEIRGAVAFERVGFPIQRFNGDRRRITFVTAPLPPADSYEFYRESEWEIMPAPRHDLREITYQLWIDPEETTEDNEPIVGGILRTERRALDPYLTEEDVPEGEDLLYIRHDLWSYELGYLEFRYFDGVEWTTTWNVPEGNPLPQLVRITIGFDSITNDDLNDVDLEGYSLRDYPFGPPDQLDQPPNPNRYSRIVRLRGADQMFSSRVQRMTAEMGEEVYTFGGEVTEEDQGDEGQDYYQEEPR